MLLSFLSGYFEYVFLTILIIIIHEFGHFLAGKLLHLKMKEIKIFMFGGVTQLDVDLNSSITKEIVMLVAGPLTQVMFLLFIMLLYLKGLVNPLTYDKFYNINIVLLKFNLLPILPLDGGKLVNNILDYFLPYNTSHIVSIIISFISLPLLFTIGNKLFVIITFVFLIIKLFEEITSHKYRFNKLLLERRLKNYKFKKKRRINNIKKIKRNEDYVLC